MRDKNKEGLSNEKSKDKQNEFITAHLLGRNILHLIDTKADLNATSCNELTIMSF